MAEPTGTDIPEEVTEEIPAGTETPEAVAEIDEEPAGTDIPEEEEPPAEEPAEEMVPKAVVDKMQTRFSKRLGHEVAKNKELQETFEKIGVSLDTKPPRPRKKQYLDEDGYEDEDAFDSALEVYDEKLLDWKDSQRAKKDIESNVETEKATRFKEFHQAAEPLRAKYKDFDDVLNDTMFGNELIDVLLGDQLTEVAYYLAKNKNEAVKFSQMAAADMPTLYREIGKLETKLSSVSPSSSNAPTPISPVSDDKGSLEVDESKLSDDDWYERKKAKRLAALKKKYG